MMREEIIGRLIYYRVNEVVSACNKVYNMNEPMIPTPHTRLLLEMPYSDYND